MKIDMTKTGRYLCLLLRHKPELGNLQMDNHGWVDTDALIAAVNRKMPLNRELLEEIVRTDEKQRYRFSEDHKRIRACQGHSVKIDLELKPIAPPEVLWHGSAERFREAIMKDGLKKMNRQFVHLSGDPATAVKVGSRRGQPLVFRVDAGAMAEAGFVFYRADNGVWLTDRVPAFYLAEEAQQPSEG